MLKSEIYELISVVHSFVFSTSIGNILATATDIGLTKLHFLKNEKFDKSFIYTKHELLLDTKKQLIEYLDCKRKIFNIELDWTGASDFYQSVWTRLLTIPYGQTCSYGDIARKLGDINKSRAIGLANGRNPIAIIVPCHRVIGADGSLTGYGGGIDIKRQLLQLENPGKWVKQEVLF